MEARSVSGDPKQQQWLETRQEDGWAVDEK